MHIKTKLINHLMLNGKKETSEKNLLKSIKELQKTSNKKTNQILQLAMIYSTPIFKLHKIRNKNRKKANKYREIPGFIKNNEARNSIAIKFVLSNIKKKGEHFIKKFNKEILLNAQNQGINIEKKNDLQKNVLTKKHFFKYYRWN